MRLCEILIRYERDIFVNVVPFTKIFRLWGFYANGVLFSLVGDEFIRMDCPRKITLLAHSQVKANIEVG